MYQIGCNPKSPELPQFMDLGKLARKLESKELVEIQDQKHLHKNLPHLTQLGKSFYNLYTKELDVLFHNIPLKTEADFTSCFFHRLQQFEDESFNPDVQLLCETFGIPKPGIEFERNNISMKINSITIEKCIKDNNKDTIDKSLFNVDYELLLLCPKCSFKQISQFKITYNLEEYNINPAEVVINCSRCGKLFFLDAYFSRIKQ